ncbi:hypothetical protein N7474_005164 [Penicillium riverlandense]|uniref:uncharacterized protein n=1 Tax=Penicillium riverlandense TaxID=1903569 RepID=UPI002548E95C|nr:uncharacterized protein N7474_005164 [Penicillium riverlandense]KAJ5819573.1 hypothetical protein N7474_005164 [Penicillium riverlandense]
MAAPTTSIAYAPSSTAANCGVANGWNLPSSDPACASRITGNITYVFNDCCGQATPHKYANDCGIYCLAEGQDIGVLRSCLQTKSDNYHDIFCNTVNATATATGAGVSNTSATSTTKTHSGSSTSHTKNAAFVNQPVSKTGLGVVALVFCSALMGLVA